MGRASRQRRVAPPAAATPTPSAALWPGAFACALATVLAYWPALSNGFVNWDDPEVLLENLHVRRLDAASLGWMWTTFHTGNWIPLTWLSHAAVYQLAHLSAWGHHAANLALHAANVALVFSLSAALLRRARERGLASVSAQADPWAAGIAALLFGLHPLHVESVAWVAERKDVLYALFFLLALRVSLWEPRDPERRRLPDWLVALCFLLALLAKPMAVTLPLALLVLDYWPQGRLPGPASAWLRPKLPLFALGALSAWVTLAAQSSQGAVAAIEQVPAGFRVMNAFHSLAFYLTKALLPLGLAPFYPIGLEAPPAFSAANLAAAAAVLAVTAWLLAKRHGPGAALLAAWAFYVVTLLPVLGLVQVGNQAAADRYTYVPLLGPFLAVAAFLSTARAGRTIAAVLLAALVPLTRAQIATWHDPVSLWERVVSAYPDVSSIAHTNFGNALHAAKRNAEAVREFRRALAIGPPHAFIQNGLGTALLDLGQTDAAITAFQAALALEPSYAVAHRNLWFAWSARGEPAKARAAAEAALRFDPDYADAWSSLGVSQGKVGDLAGAEASFQRALALDPDNPDFLTNLSVTWEGMGRHAEAEALRRRAQRLAPQ